MSKKFPTDVIEQAQVIADSWRQINPELTLGDLSQAGMQEKLESVIPIEKKIITLENSLTNLRNERDAGYEEIWDYVKRARMGIKAIYGDDSSQYEMVGGTRLSDRKPMARRTVTTA